MSRACPSPSDLERGFCSRDASLETHARGCSSCGESWRRIGELHALARLIEVPPSSPERRENVRSALMSMAPPARRARWPLVLAISAACAALSVALWPDPEVTAPPAAIYRARITPLDAAAFFTEGAQPDEIVRLVHGSVSFDVDRLERGERFRVIAGDAEIEVRGTAFDVSARDDRLQEVEVRHGVVEVRHAGRISVLRDGDRWTAPERAPARAEKRRPPRRPAKVAPPENDRIAYEEAWSALRREDFEGAAASFSRALEQSRDPILREDAEFFLAVSLARAGQVERSIEIFEQFLASRAGSARAGEAAAMLGWIRYDRGEEERAASLFEQAARSTSVRSKTSGEKGLEAIRRKRNEPR